MFTNNGASVRRVVRLYEQASDESLAYGLAWYYDAHTFATELAAEHDVTIAQAAGVVAALSPRLEWNLNKRKAAEVLATGTTSGLSLSVTRAQRIAQGEAPLDVLGGPKVRAFFSNIADPDGSIAVTIDRHAIDALNGWTVSSDKQRKVLERKGAYEAAADIYRRAGALVGKPAHVVQAVVWCEWRDAKALAA